MSPQRSCMVEMKSRGPWWYPQRSSQWDMLCSNWAASGIFHHISFLGTQIIIDRVSEIIIFLENWKRLLEGILLDLDDVTMRASNDLYLLFQKILSFLGTQVMLGNCLAENDDTYKPIWKMFDHCVIQAQYYLQPTKDNGRALCKTYVQVDPGDLIRTRICYTAESGSIQVSIIVIARRQWRGRFQQAQCDCHSSAISAQCDFVWKLGRLLFQVSSSKETWWGRESFQGSTLWRRWWPNKSRLAW